MSTDECAFCKSFYRVPTRREGYSDYRCRAMDAYFASHWTDAHDAPEDDLIFYLSVWIGDKHCEFYKPTGTGYLHFFRYINIALKRGRDTQ